MLLPEFILPLASQFTDPGSLLVHLGSLQIRWHGLLIACCAVLRGTNLSTPKTNRANLTWGHRHPWRDFGWTDGSLNLCPL